MKKVIITILFGLIGAFALFALTFKIMADKPKELHQKNNDNSERFQNGDIIFQTSRSSQSKAIQLATKSKYSHMGIIYEAGEQYYVYEAVQPVKLTKLTDWIKRGEGTHYVVKRLRNFEEVLTKENLKKMKTYGDKFKGKSYDIYFEWSDDKIYCSELVWKIYNIGN
jgi:Permuted papain-like amidase enzyme, YaeF/YiiX, C92 family